MKTKKWSKHRPSDKRHWLYQNFMRPGTWCNVEKCEVNKDGVDPEEKTPRHSGKEKP